MSFEENKQTKFVLRRSRNADREKILEVEAKSTPNLQYLQIVFDLFVSDQVGELCVVEVDGEVVACGKFTVMPDKSAWLETLRVIPAYQGLGIGKRIFKHFFDLARMNDITTMRMYTGINNIVSKGLAERFGFKVAATYRGAWLQCLRDVDHSITNTFNTVTDPEKAASLLMQFHKKWAEFLVMNRTFYAITPELCLELVHRGLIYEDPIGGSVIILGARFMPKQALHIGVFDGRAADCLTFALQKGIESGAKRLSCFFPPSAEDIQQALLEHGFQMEKSDLIVMEVQA